MTETVCQHLPRQIGTTNAREQERNLPEDTLAVCMLRHPESILAALTSAATDTLTWFDV